MNVNTLPKYVVQATPMTVGELKKKIRNLPNDIPVYLVVDKYSDDAWDDDKEQWRFALPLVYATRERIYGDAFEGDGYNLLLEPESL